MATEYQAQQVDHTPTPRLLPVVGPMRLLIQTLIHAYHLTINEIQHYLLANAQQHTPLTGSMQPTYQLLNQQLADGFVIDHPNNLKPAPNLVASLTGPVPQQPDNNSTLTQSSPQMMPKPSIEQLKDANQLNLSNNPLLGPASFVATIGRNPYFTPYGAARQLTPEQQADLMRKAGSFGVLAPQAGVIQHANSLDDDFQIGATDPNDPLRQHNPHAPRIR